MMVRTKWNWSGAQFCALAGLCFLILSGLLAILSASSATAHEGHDHGPRPTISRALPRVEAQTDLVEMVAVYDDGRLFIYLDHFSGNTPVAGADVTLTLNGADASVREVARGIYMTEFRAPAGEVAVMMIVNTRDFADVVVATLTLENAASETSIFRSVAIRSAAWALLLGVVIILLALPTVRRRFVRRVPILP
jgi:hypothetical protein